MSWFGNTLHPTLEHVFASHEAPSSPAAAAKEIEAAGYPDVARYVASLNTDAYEDMLWTCHVNVVNQEWPAGFTTPADDLYNYEHAMELKS